MRTFIFRHGKASISHNRFNGHRKPQVVKTTAFDGSVHRMTINWHTALREERHAFLTRKNESLAEEHTSMIIDSQTEDHAEESVFLPNPVENLDDIDFTRDNEGNLTWASFGNDNQKPVTRDPLPRPWRHPSRKDYLMSARLLH